MNQEKFYTNKFIVTMSNKVNDIVDFRKTTHTPFSMI